MGEPVSDARFVPIPWKVENDGSPFSIRETARSRIGWIIQKEIPCVTTNYTHRANGALHWFAAHYIGKYWHFAPQLHLARARSQQSREREKEKEIKRKRNILLNLASLIFLTDITIDSPLNGLSRNFFHPVSRTHSRGDFSWREFNMHFATVARNF